MTTNIQNKNTILKQLEWDLFFGKAQAISLFPETASRIMENEVDQQRLEAVYTITEKFIEPENYEEIVEIQHKLSDLNFEHINHTSGSKLAKGEVFSLERLATLIRIVEVFIEHKKFLSDNLLEFLSEDTERFISDFRRNTLREFRTFVSKDCEIDFFKHPKLNHLYKQQMEIEQSSRGLLSKLRQNSKFENTLQFESHDIINDKYVLPIKSDGYNSGLGAIIARSESGRTLYVEPLEVKNLNLMRMEVVLKIDQILHDIARDFSSRLAAHGSQIDYVTDLIFAFDEYRTRANFAMEFHLNRPVLCSDHKLELDSFFHPLIENPVKNSLLIKPSDKGLVISGPNTGGKTATIKAIALTSFFIKHGLFVSARKAEVFNFQNIFYFGNDQQSLEEGLSSFAAEVKNYTELLSLLGESNLVIIDEIFNSTSSEEASALAFSFFEEITKTSGSKVIVSTHHQTLKTITHSESNYISCHVGFDESTNSPTYKLIFGAPGSSLALDIFKKLSGNDSKCEEIYNLALKRLDNKMINYEKLLHGLSEREGKLSKIIEENERLNKELKNQKEAAKGLIQLKVDEEVSKVKRELSKIEKKAYSLLKQTKSGEIKSTRAQDKKFSQLQKEISPFITKKDEGPRVEKFKDMPRPKELVVGNKYFCSFVNQTVTLIKLNNKKEAVVSRGNLKIKCPIDSLHSPNKQAKSGKVIVNTFRTAPSKLEYDCRGMRLHEFQNIVENAIPDLLSGELPFINFIHGHGNGTLKKWLRDFITKNDSIMWDKGESGNDGETRVIAK
tara:strand:- start:91049 stop:93403 length:2355 start_codon:yes stop_codon:yes gene_type:complete